jgi:hypothetical protein
MAPFYRGFQLVAWICDESPFRGVSIRDGLVGVFHHGDDCPTEADAHNAWIDAQYEPRRIYSIGRWVNRSELSTKCGKPFQHAILRGQTSDRSADDLEPARTSDRRRSRRQTRAAVVSS